MPKFLSDVNVVAKMAIDNNVVDQIALDIDASNTTANVIDVNAQPLTTGSALFIDCNSLTTGHALDIDVDDAIGTAHDIDLAKIAYNKSADAASGEAVSVTGLLVDLDDDADGNANDSVVLLVGVSSHVTHENADAVVASATCFSGVVAGTCDQAKGLFLNMPDGVNFQDIHMRSSASSSDYAQIRTGASGALTIETTDGSGANGDITVEADGSVDINGAVLTLDAATSIELEGATNVTGKLKTTEYIHEVSGATPGNVGVGAEVVYFGSGTVAAGYIYYYKDNGSWEITNANTAATSAGMLGVALDGGTASSVGMCLRGMVCLYVDSTGDVGDPLFLKTTVNGATDDIPPTGANDVVRIIGYCLNADGKRVFFNPDNTFIEIA